MISFNSLSIKECKDFIEKLALFSKEYQHKISCVLDFHSYHDVKNAKIAHFIGLTKTTQTAILWNNVLNLEILIPNIKKKTSPTLSFFGKEVTDDEVEQLVKTIPSTPK